MRSIKICEFNIDTACVELRFTDGTLISPVRRFYSTPH